VIKLIDLLTENEPKKGTGKAAPYGSGYAPVKELVTDTKVICDNCDWSWAIADGGKSPFLCHKCGHDNTPKKLPIQDSLLLTSILENLVGEAFSEFPASEDEIPNEKIKELFRVILNYPNLSINDPLVLNPKSPNTAKISRSLQRDSNFIEYLNNKLNIELDPMEGAKWNGINIKWGEGSRGGRGIKSKGLGFENELASDLELLQEEGISESNKDQFKYPDLIIEISKELGLKKGNFTVVPEGDKNQSRPLGFESGGPVVEFSQGSAAETLTDITINKKSAKYYLSAKFGNTLTFFNSGITKILPASEIKAGKITNSDGVALLDTFGIDNKTFCKVFNDYPDADFSKVNGASTKYSIPKMKNLIKSGIGDGYYMVKAGGKSSQFEHIDSEYTNTASDVSAPIIYYGGIGGNGKRVDVTFESPLYKFKINIRNKQGGLYPTHIMCDYIKK
jgi:hypothetical protein